MSAQSDSATEYGKGSMIRAGFDVNKYRENFGQINWSKKETQPEVPYTQTPKQESQ